MKIDVLTIYPGMFPGPLDESIVKRARESGRLQLGVRDLRDYTHDRHRTVDDLSLIHISEPTRPY